MPFCNRLLQFAFVPTQDHVIFLNNARLNLYYYTLQIQQCGTKIWNITQQVSYHSHCRLQHIWFGRQSPSCILPTWKCEYCICGLCGTASLLPPFLGMFAWPPVLSYWGTSHYSHMSPRADQWLPDRCRYDPRTKSCTDSACWDSWYCYSVVFGDWARVWITCFLVLDYLTHFKCWYKMLFWE